MNRMIFLLVLFSSCARVQQISKTHLDRVHIASKINQYFLADLPHWANFSEQGKCRRNENIRFLHYAHLNQSFSYNYSFVAYLQLLFNEKYRESRKHLQRDFLSPRMEEKIFFQAQDEINSGILPFHLPGLKRVHLLWIDPALKNPRYQEALKNILNTDDFYQGHPILVSQCLNRDQMGLLIHSLTQEDVGFRFISSEMFSPFDQNFNLTHEFQLSLDTILSGKKIILYTIGDWYPTALKGLFKIKRIK